MNVSEIKVGRGACELEGDAHAASPNLLTGLNDGTFELNEMNTHGDYETSCG